MRSKIAILAGMIGNKVVQMAGRKGTSLTGKIALAVKPDILNYPFPALSFLSPEQTEKQLQTI